MWVNDDRKTLESAFETKSFARGFKDQSARPEAQSSEDFVNAIAQRQIARILQKLGLLRRSGGLISGYDKVYNALKGASQNARLIIANDALETDNSRKLQKLAGQRNVGVWSQVSIETLSKPLGLEAIAYLLVNSGSGHSGAGVKLVSEIDRLVRISGESDPNRPVG